ncbi:AraC family transcriptional regulator [Acinetobacter tandoii]|uniref:AraC family transcriptional regulator n=1 Tax=Acinetobacter tandoii TaxID=202954 RepID=A0A5N4WF13_9GAMM|nr:AraC family transcriptional regulator [Acinetobacter tandoii]KAB1855086.1 AraC family transcriptional regulator [Acinetobacter tandoii]
MQNHIPNIPARYYFKILNILEERNISTESVLSSIHVDLKKYLTSPDLKITQEQVSQFVSFCLKYPKNYDLAFEIGRLLKVSSHNLVGYAILTSNNLEQALIYISKYFTLIIPSFKFSYFYHEDQSMELVCEPVYNMDTLSLNFHLEAIAVALHCSIQELVEDRLLAYDIFMSINEPLHIQLYLRLSKVKFHFNTLKQPSFRVRLTKPLLQQSLHLADEGTRRAIELKCQEQIYEIKNNMDLVLWLKHLFMSSTETISMKECAQLLNISSKTLQRHLKLKNISYQQIKTDVSMEKAQQMLSHTSKSIFEIAEELDYASASNFSRSFKLHVGSSPSTFRKKQRGF